MKSHFKNSPNQNLLWLLRDEKKTRDAGHKFLNDKSLNELKSEIKKRKEIGKMRSDAGVKRAIKNKLDGLRVPSIKDLMGDIDW